MLSTSSSLLASKQPPTARAMTYDPYLTNSSASGEGKVPEFLRPLPKPAARYTGEQNNFMPSYSGVRMMSKPLYHHTAVAEEAVNLMQKHKEANSAVYQFPMQYFPAHAYTPLYFNSAMPHQFSIQQPVQQQQQRPGMAFNFSKAGQSLLIQDNRLQHPPPPMPQQQPPPPPTLQQQQHQPPPVPPPQQPLPERPPFKVPSGKEGSLKHRILTRPEPAPLEKHAKGKSHFSRGSLIKLGNEKLIKIEDIRTEDFILAAEKCPALRLDPSTIVRISESTKRPHEAMIVLRYGPDQQQQTVEMEVLLDHPFFVYGKGWSSISPEKSLSSYDLPCLRLIEGDMCISLSPRQSAGTTSLASSKRRWSAPAENGVNLDEDCLESPAAQRTKH